MPFSSLNDPVDLARAQAVLKAVWDEVRSSTPDAFEQRQRTRLAYIVAALVAVAEDEEDLRRKVLVLYRQSAV
jgi:hypothetical protein